MPFPTPLERLLAMRLLRAKRSEGGASVATAIAVIGVALAVFALVVTLAVRAGFRAEFVGSMLGANPHLTAVPTPVDLEDGRFLPVWPDPERRAQEIAAVPGITAAWPVVRGMVMLGHEGRMSGVDVQGIDARGLEALGGIEAEDGSWTAFHESGGVAIGARLAEHLGVGVGDRVQIVSPDGVRSPFGVTPRIEDRTVAVVFTGGRYDVDRGRMFLPFADAQGFFHREGLADEIQATVADPERVEGIRAALLAAGPEGVRARTWQDAAGPMLRALKMEDRVMLVIMSVLVLVSAMAIVSGLVMLARNKRAAVGILRTVGMTKGGVLRIFLMVGLATGTMGALLGAVGGVVFARHIDAVMAWVDRASGGGAWDPSVRGVYILPARVLPGDVAFAVVLAVVLAALASIVPALGAARLNPVEALRDDG